MTRFTWPFSWVATPFPRNLIYISWQYDLVVKAALISDRKECLKERTLKLTTQDGIEITDYSSFSGTSQQPSLSMVHNKEAITNVGHVDARQT